MKVWTVAIGNVPMFPTKKVRELIKFIKSQEGFVGMNPCYPYGTLLLFDSENNAKGARNMLRFRGVQCGDNICQGEIDD